MNIVFWSPLSGHGATTSNMACVAMMASLMYCYRSISFQSGYSSNGLDQSFIGHEAAIPVNTLREEFTYYMGKGIDGMLGSMYMGASVNEKIADYSVEIIKGLTYYLPSSMKNSEELFNEKMSCNVVSLINECSRRFDITFIDNQSKVEKVSRNVFLNTDLCVINLSQNPELIREAKKDIEKLEGRCRIFYVIGRYHDSSRISVKNIAGMLGVKTDDIGVVPYCSDYLEAVLAGSTKEFLKSNVGCSRRNPNYYFFSEVKSLTRKILNKAGVGIG